MLNVNPDSPLEPLFRSLYIEHPSFDINSIDIVTDRNNIRKLGLATGKDCSLSGHIYLDSECIETIFAQSRLGKRQKLLGQLNFGVLGMNSKKHIRSLGSKTAPATIA
jgi:hypothetical protein